MIRVLINEDARQALIAEGAQGNLESAGGDLYWVDLEEDVWTALQRQMAGEIEHCETAEEEAKCLSNVILRLANKQVGRA